MIFTNGISFCIHCCLGLILFTRTCAANTTYVWLAGDESYNLSSINQTAEEDILWIFNTTIGHRIQISFLNFDFEFGYNFMNIGDGTNVDKENVHFGETSTYTRLASFSGADIPSMVTSVGNTAWIRLRGDSREDWKRHFDMTVTPTNTSDITKVEEDDVTSIKSMSYPSNYPNNFYRLWDIQAPQGFVISVIVRVFDIEHGNDNLFIGDGVDRFTNRREEWQDWTGMWQDEVLALRDFRSSTNSITMIFTTDFSTTRSGFWIQLQAIKNTAQTTITTTTTTTTTTTVNPLISSTRLSKSPAGIFIVASPVVMLLLVILMLFFVYRWYHLRQKNRILLRSQTDLAYTSRDYFTLDPDIVQQDTSPLQDLTQYSIGDNIDGLGLHIYNSIGDLPGQDNNCSRRLTSFAGPRIGVSLPPLPVNRDGSILPVPINNGNVIPENCSGVTLPDDCNDDVMEACCVIPETYDDYEIEDKLGKLEENPYKKANYNLYMDVRRDAGCELPDEQEDGCMEYPLSHAKVECSKTEDEIESPRRETIFEEDEDCGVIMIDNILYEPCSFDKQS